MKEFKLIINNLKKVLNITSDKELAVKLNMKTQTFSERKRTNSIPHKEIIELCLINKLDINKIYENNLEKDVDYIEEINKLVHDTDYSKLKDLYSLIKTNNSILR